MKYIIKFTTNKNIPENIRDVIIDRLEETCEMENIIVFKSLFDEDTDKSKE